MVRHATTQTGYSLQSGHYAFYMQSVVAQSLVRAAASCFHPHVTGDSISTAVLCSLPGLSGLQS